MNKYPRIKDLMEDNDFTQKHIAEILNMHKTIYTRYESGEREIPFNIAILLAKFYNISLDYMAGLSSERRSLKRSSN